MAYLAVVKLTALLPRALRTAVATSITTLTFLFALLSATSQHAWARAEGYPGEPCSTCHAGKATFKPVLTADPAILMPGQSTTLTLTIPGVAAGFYLQSNLRGVFTEIEGEGVKKVADTRLTHAAPKRGSGGQVTFKVTWTAPQDPGGVDFDITAVSVDGNNQSGAGDSEAIHRFSLSIGCQTKDVYVDQDGDGYGMNDIRGPRHDCESAAGYATRAGDCNDADKNANPAGTEVCNQKDDDCDGKFDEDLQSVTLYRDDDHDGYGVRFGTETVIGCPNGLGWSPTRDDCNDNDRAVNPGSKELCNSKDDNCNGRTDEGARAVCGVGSCLREAPGCGEGVTCTPGAPNPELCNGLDDNCDGVVDNGAPCTGDKNVCFKGACVTGQQAQMMMSAEPPPIADAGAPSDARQTSTETGTAAESTPTTPGRTPKGGCAYGDRVEGSRLSVALMCVAMFGWWYRRRG